MAEQVVVGGSVAALVAADALTARGESVRLLLPERGVGGGFASIRREGRVLELGVRLLELGYEDMDPDPPPLSEYRPALGAHRPYTALIDHFTRELLGDRVTEVPPPLMFFDGRIVDDLYFSTDPLALRAALGPDERAMIAAQAQSARATAGCDAGLLDPSRADQLADSSVDEASLSNHGRTFHDRFIAPFAQKIVPDGGRHVPATMRRKIWMPLFWPATLAQAAGTAEVAFRPERPFHTVSPDGCGGLVDALRDRVQSAGASVETVGRLERLHSAADGSVELAFSTGSSVRTSRPVIGTAPSELFAAVGVDYAPATARSVICWLESAPEQLTQIPSLLNVVDADIPALRVSSSGRGAPGRQLLTVELRHDLPEEEIAAAATRALYDTGLLSADGTAEVVMSAAASTFALPTRDNTELFAHAHSALTDLDLDLYIVGGATDFGADALGEQIVQGLLAAEVLQP